MERVAIGGFNPEQAESLAGVGCVKRTNQAVRCTHPTQATRHFGSASQLSTLERRIKMQRILWATAAAVLIGLPVAARAGEPRVGLAERGREIVQAGWHKCSSKRSSCDSRSSCCDKRSSCRSSCDPCGGCADDVRIGQLIETLLYHEKACKREWAADRLDDYNWTQHPEIVTALTYAMQTDCERCVRVTAADSLKDMRVSDPDTIGAMQFTRGEDPSCRVRYKAKWGIIKGEKSRPPCLTYVSGYATNYSTGNQADDQMDEPETKPTPRLRAAPAPEPEPATRPNLRQREETIPMPEPDKGTDAKRGVRGFISSAMAKVRPRS
jgi:hypothetical protein